LHLDIGALEEEQDRFQSIAIHLPYICSNYQSGFFGDVGDVGDTHLAL